MENDTKKQIMFDKMKERKKEVKIVRRIVLIVAIIVFAIIGIGGYTAYNYVTGAMKPIDEKATTGIEVEIPMGSGITTISRILEENGIIKDQKVFKYYTKFKNESQFQAGDYTLTQAMTFDEIIESLKTGRVYRQPIFSMTIPEGLTLEEIATRVAKSTDHSAKEFMDTATSEAFITQMMSKYPVLITEEVFAENIRYSLEGYLYPATYPFYEEKPSIATIIETMIKEMDSMVTDYSAALVDMDMTVHQFLTFASLLEEEATAQTDRETIASVFNNRLNIGMPLQTDPTVLYAIGSHKDRVLFSDLEIENPYNTYKNVGLTPGPISGAGKSSLEATISPSETDYLYFLADPTGMNHFAKTYDEHLANIAKYLR